MNRKEMLARLQEIEDKYDRFHSIYGQWLRTVEDMTRDLGLKNYAERNALPVFQKGQGVECALQILRWNLGRKPRLRPEEVVAILTRQSQEPSCEEPFLEGVRMVLFDATCAGPLTPFTPASFGSITEHAT